MQELAVDAARDGSGGGVPDPPEGADDVSPSGVLHIRAGTPTVQALASVVITTAADERGPHRAEQPLRL